MQKRNARSERDRKTKMDDRRNTKTVEDGRDAEVIGANSRVSVLNAVFQ